MSDSVQPYRRQPTRLLCPWDSPGKNTGVGCHFLLLLPSMGFSRQEYWSGLPFPSSGDLPNPGIEPGSPASCALPLYRLSHRGRGSLSSFLSYTLSSLGPILFPCSPRFLYSPSSSAVTTRGGSNRWIASPFTSGGQKLLVAVTFLVY